MPAAVTRSFFSAGGAEAVDVAGGKKGSGDCGGHRTVRADAVYAGGGAARCGGVRQAAMRRVRDARARDGIRSRIRTRALRRRGVGATAGANARLCGGGRRRGTGQWTADLVDADPYRAGAWRSGGGGSLVGSLVWYSGKGRPEIGRASCRGRV